GFEPAPSPLVSLLPIWTFTGALALLSAWQSVLATMKSTPVILDMIIRLTALLPPPPTPMTLMRAPCTGSSSKLSFIFLALFPSSLSSIVIISPPDPAVGLPPSEKFAEPGFHLHADLPEQEGGHVWTERLRRRGRPVHREPHHRGAHRTVDAVGEAADA